MEAKEKRRLGLGVDTGGTYTDAAVVDLISREVLVKAKSPTTHDNLSAGILGAVDAVLESTAFSIEEIWLVGISTTLATNSILEGRGSEVGLIGIGWRPEAGQETGAKRSAFVKGSYDMKGRVTAPLDEAEVEVAVGEIAPEVEAFAVSGFFGTINPANEERVREIIMSQSKLPVVVGHELTSDLGILERSVTAVLNARLLPVIEGFMNGVETALRRRSIMAPIMVYKGDGSLMSVERAKIRPVETILSGPAASLVGGRVLSGLDTCIVLDIGGTSTDIAFLDDGFPRLSRSGATVGRWKTRVRATDVWTAALGGDSNVGMVDGRISFGPERVVPLGVAAERFPMMLHKMQKNWRIEHLIAYQRDSTRLAEEERQVLKVLQEKGPMSLEEISAVLPEIYSVRSCTNGLKAKGYIVASGLTPTDLLNVAGVFSRGSRVAAELGVELFASTYELDKVEFVSSTLDLIGSRMAEELLMKIIYDGSGGTLEGKAGEYVLDVMTGAIKSEMEVEVRLDRPIVGIGASASFFVPRLEKLLRTKVVVPHDHDVGNAVGAVCSQVYESVTVQVHSRGGLHHVIAPFNEPLVFDRLELAVDTASKIASDHVASRVRSSGGVDIVTMVEVRDRRSRVRSRSQCDQLNWIEIKARATGRPDLVG